MNIVILSVPQLAQTSTRKLLQWKSQWKPQFLKTLKLLLAIDMQQPLIKSLFMNEILELKNEIAGKQYQISERGNIQTPNCSMKKLKIQISLSKQGDIFLKSQLDKK